MWNFVWKGAARSSDSNCQSARDYSNVHCWWNATRLQLKSTPSESWNLNTIRAKNNPLTNWRIELFTLNWIRLNPQALPLILSTRKQTKPHFAAPEYLPAYCKLFSQIVIKLINASLIKHQYKRGINSGDYNFLKWLKIRNAKTCAQLMLLLLLHLKDAFPEARWVMTRQIKWQVLFAVVSRVDYF